MKISMIGTLALFFLILPLSGTPDERSGAINFDDQIVEGMNRNPFDALTQIGNQDNKKQNNIYQYKMNFLKEIKETTQEMGYQQ